MNDKRITDKLTIISDVLIQMLQTDISDEKSFLEIQLVEIAKSDPNCKLFFLILLFYFFIFLFFFLFFYSFFYSFFFDFFIFFYFPLNFL